ncbi:MAG: CDP-diacylglycerol--glycerol-3-phosphate 3-phosphatidyltransferase [Oscillospiraceae bacterium]|jgi:CDP-diacylglycerol--glycerol-3-phosphate 3-phosphatidyltransferase|nr:CDP-diacylglycerol--glycerol-3-phosphate 3-phosphatidyltransferase [Oscillospiraceae bacterium]
MKLKMLPNLLSGFRICLVPVFTFTYFAEKGEVKGWAVTIYIIAAVTDFLDGFIARRLSLTSNLGKVLDPLGDKLMTAAALTCITIDGLIPAWAIAVVVTKELLMGVGGLVLHSRAKAEIPPSNIFGKTATVFFVVTCAALMLFPSINGAYASAMIGVAVGLASAALISYILTFSAEMKKRLKSDMKS